MRRQTRRGAPADARRLSSSDQLVYFIQQGNDDEGPIKIGMSNNIHKRLAALQTSNPYPLRLLAVRSGGHREEARLHLRFRLCHLHGEWFTPIEELFDEITSSDVWVTPERHSALGRARVDALHDDERLRRDDYDSCMDGFS